MCHISLFLKHTLPVATRVRGKVVRIFGYCKTKQRQKQVTSHHKTNSVEKKKDSFYITCYNCHGQLSQLKSDQCQYHRRRLRKGEDIRHTSLNLVLLNKPFKVKVRFSLEQATKAQRWRRGTALLFL